MAQRAVTVQSVQERTISKGANQGKPYWSVKVQTAEGAAITVPVFDGRLASQLEPGKSYNLEVDITSGTKGTTWDLKGVVAEVKADPEKAPAVAPSNGNMWAQRSEPDVARNAIIEATGRIVSTVFTGAHSTTVDFQTASISKTIVEVYRQLEALRFGVSAIEVNVRVTNPPEPIGIVAQKPLLLQDDGRAAAAAEVRDQQFPNALAVLNYYAKAPYKLGPKDFTPHLAQDGKALKDRTVDELLGAARAVLAKRQPTPAAPAASVDDLPF